MECYICKKDSTEFSSGYSQKVCLDCDAMLNESEVKYRKFMDGYKKNHACCPICGSTEGINTLVAYAYNSDNPEGYNDLSDFTCSGCGDKHVVHERVPYKTKNPE